MQDVQAIRDFYLSNRELNNNIYQIWEAGRAFKDSVTPSTWCDDYREWMVRFIERQVMWNVSKHILSIGCGNAFVERDLCQMGYSLFSIDINASAVELARSKGVPAQVADFYTWEPEEENVDLIYGDGVLGHFYLEDSQCQTALARLHSWLKPSEGIIVISNDASKDGQAVVSAPGVKGFYHFSEDWVISQLKSAGFKLIESAIYTYGRPISGKRNRLVVSARA
ncbi:MAG TPA: class I SAM-dependent methyltransferase [Blastocatellia bacterium]|jgi:predicted TPR repeat methyltransferase|nr:class I SAM-dependent methyltransferase [Blastocatellia bacterium]